MGVNLIKKMVSGEVDTDLEIINQYVRKWYEGFNTFKQYSLGSNPHGVDCKEFIKRNKIQVKDREALKVFFEYPSSVDDYVGLSESDRVIFSTENGKTYSQEALEKLILQKKEEITKHLILGKYYYEDEKTLAQWDRIFAKYGNNEQEIEAACEVPENQDPSTGKPNPRKVLNWLDKRSKSDEKKTASTTDPYYDFVSEWMIEIYHCTRAPLKKETAFVKEKVEQGYSLKEIRKVFDIAAEKINADGPPMNAIYKRFDEYYGYIQKGKKVKIRCDEKRSDEIESNSEISRNIDPGKSTEAEYDRIYDEMRKNLRPYQKEVCDELVSFFEDPDTKYTTMPLPVGSGKTYLTPYMAVLANSIGKRFVYACHNKAVLKEVLDEMLRQLGSVYPSVYPLGSGYLFIPALIDGYRHFFSGIGMYEYQSNSRDNQEEVKVDKSLGKFIMDASKTDYQQFMDFILNKKEKAEQILKTLDRKERLYNYYHMLYYQAESVLYALNSVPDILKQMDEAKGVSERIFEDSNDRFSKAEKNVRAYFGKICTYEFQDNCSVMAEKLPWLTKLYPGMLFSKASAVFMTFAKTEKAIELFGKNATGSLDLPTENGDKNNIVLLDECDLYCTALLGSSVDDAVKYDIDLLSFILTAKTILTNVYDKKDDWVRLPKEMLFSEKNEVDAKKRVSDTLRSIQEFCKEYGIRTDSYVVKYEPEDEERNQRTPVLNTLAHRTTILGFERDKKDDKKTPVDIAVKEYPEETVIKMSPVYEYGDRSVKNFIQRAAVLINQILGLIRILHQNSETNTPGITSMDALTTVASRFRYNSKEEIGFISRNLYAHKTQTVNSGSIYARGYSVHALNDSTSHYYSTTINTAKLTGLPDYKMANLVYNQSKTILSSGTVGMQSLHNVDFKYVHDAVTEKMRADRLEEEIKKNDGKEVDQKEIIIPEIYSPLKSVEELVSTWKDASKDNYADSRIHCEGYERTDNKGDGYYYMEATGEEIPSEYVSAAGKLYDENDFSHLAFAAYSLALMIKNNNRVGLVFASALPADGCNTESHLYYNDKNLQVMREKVAAKHNIDKDRIRIQKLDSRNIESEKRRLMRGIEADTYTLFVTAYSSIGTGTNISYVKNGEEGTTYDIDAVFLDNITNIIPGPSNGKRHIAEKQRDMLNTEYYLVKFGMLQMNRGYTMDTYAWKGIGHILNKVYKGDSVFSRNLHKADYLSPYHMTAGARLLQSFHRADRGKKKNSDITVAASSTLFQKCAITKELYDKVPYSFLFEVFLNHFVDTFGITGSPQGDDALCAKKYREGNIYVYNVVNKVLRHFSTAKKEGKPIDARYERNYHKIRESAATMGYVDEGEEHPYGYSELLSSDKWKVLLGGTKEDSDAERQKKAYVDREVDYGMIASGTTFLEQLDFYTNNGLFGDGWEQYFPIMIKHRKEIEKDGFKYVPYTETYYIFLGVFYENILKALMLPNGALYTGYSLCELPKDQFEDADMRVKGTSVLIDAKAYSVEHTVTTEGNLLSKMSRMKYKDNVLIYINAKVTEVPSAPDQETHSRENGKDYSIYRIHGLASYEDDKMSIMEKFQSHRNVLKKLFDSHRIEG